MEDVHGPPRFALPLDEGMGSENPGDATPIAVVAERDHRRTGRVYRHRLPHGDNEVGPWVEVVLLHPSIGERHPQCAGLMPVERVDADELDVMPLGSIVDERLIE